MAHLPTATLSATELPFPTGNEPQRFLIQTDTLSVLANWECANTSESLYQLTPLFATPGGRQVEVRRLRFSQTDNQGFNRLDADMARLTDWLLLDLSLTGQLNRVLNRAELQEKFTALWPNLLHHYQNDAQITPVVIDNLGTILDDEGHLERVLANAPELGVLLPALYNQTYPVSADPGQGVPGTTRLDNVFSTLSLPLLTATYAQPDPPPGVALCLRVAGRLDAANYAYEDARKAVKALTGAFEADPTPDVQYAESYEFDARHRLLYAGRMAIYDIPGVFMTKIVTTLCPGGNPA